MRTLINHHRYRVTWDQAFDRVIENCSRLRRGQAGAWLGSDMIAAYRRMHDRGLAASVEVWDTSGQLVGGLYGVTLLDCFFGESMFSLVPSASKLALIELAHIMKDNGGKLIDCQFETPHLKTMGGEHISYDEYMKILQQTNI